MIDEQDIDLSLSNDYIFSY